jgi:hypothetical protein
MLHGAQYHFKDEFLFEALVLADKYEVTHSLLDKIQTALTKFIEGNLTQAIQYLDRMDKLQLSPTFKPVHKVCLKKVLMHTGNLDAEDCQEVIESLPLEAFKHVLQSEAKVNSENTGTHCNSATYLLSMVSNISLVRGLYMLSFK